MAAGIRTGSAIATSTSWVQIAGELSGSAQAAARVTNAAGADSVRRRLSTIFQRAITGRRVGIAPGARPAMIHGRSCQSPRAQRCWREAETSYDDGNSSNSSMSLTSPARAKSPSNRSWLRSVFSGVRPASAASNVSIS